MTNGKWGKWFSVSSQDSLPSSPTMGRWMGDDGLISKEMDLSKVAHRSEYRIVVAAQYRIGESDMHPDLEWLAENVSEWPREPEAGRFGIGWNGINGGREADYIRRVDPFSGEYTKDQWLQARQQLNLPTPGISDEGEEECLNLAHERMADNREQSRSDGSTASYYRLPEGCTELQHLISHRNMNAQAGEIFRARYRYGMASHSDQMRDARKILFYAMAEVERLDALEAGK